MQKSVVLFMCCWLASPTLWGQYQLVRQIYGAHTLFEADSLGNIYTSSLNALVHYGPNGEKTEKNLPFWGEISSISSKKTNEILVFSAADNKIVRLDSSLELKQAPVLLETYGLAKCPAVTAASFGLMWLYDNYLNYAFSVDTAENILFETGTVSRFADGQTKVGMMAESEGYLFVNEESSGIHIFSTDSRFSTKLPYTSVDDFQVQGQNFMFVRNNVLIVCNWSTGRETHLNLPDRATKVRIWNDLLYCSDGKSIKVYKKIEN